MSTRWIIPPNVNAVPDEEPLGRCSGNDSRCGHKNGFAQPMTERICVLGHGLHGRGDDCRWEPGMSLSGGSTSYDFGQAGSVDCPAGFEKVSKSQCDALANGKSCYSRGSWSSPNFPSGCYLNVAKGNYNWNNKGNKAHSNARPACTKITTTTSAGEPLIVSLPTLKRTLTRPSRQL